MCFTLGVVGVHKSLEGCRGVARISARGVPKSLGNKGVASCDARACANALSLVPRPFLPRKKWPGNEAKMQCASAIQHCAQRREEKRPRNEATQMRGIKALNYHVCLMLSTTPILYCKRPIDPRALHSQGLGDEVTRASILFSYSRVPDYFAYALDPGKTVWPGPTPFVREGGGVPGNAETACLRHWDAKYPREFGTGIPYFWGYQIPCDTGRGEEIMPGIIWEYFGAARIREYSRNNFYTTRQIFVRVCACSHVIHN